MNFPRNVYSFMYSFCRRWEGALQRLNAQWNGSQRSAFFVATIQHVGGIESTSGSSCVVPLAFAPVRIATTGMPLTSRGCDAWNPDARNPRGSG